MLPEEKTPQLFWAEALPESTCLSVSSVLTEYVGIVADYYRYGATIAVTESSSKSEE